MWNKKVRSQKTLIISGNRYRKYRVSPTTLESGESRLWWRRGFAMDTTGVSFGQAHQADDLSTGESDLDDAVLPLPRVNGVDPLIDSEEESSADEDDDSNEEWELDSLFEDTLEEMGDEHLLEGGENF
jgi:hypothetical protein